MNYELTTDDSGYRGFAYDFNENLIYLPPCADHVDTDGNIRIFSTNTNKWSTESFIDYLIGGLNHEVIHHVCNVIKESMFFDPLLRPRGINGLCDF